MTPIEIAQQVRAKAFTWTSEAELAWLSEQVQRGRKRVLEIGTYMGASAKVMALSGATVDCLDLFEVAGTHEVAKALLVDELNSLRVHIYPANAGVTSAKLYRAGKRYDMIWIDDGHTYPDVVRDCLSALLLGAQGALVCGHDFERNPPNDVARAVLDCFGQPEFGPGSIWYL